ncbi:hypothetical protein VitviT2T_002031 [Vitis vinifera]|uniref:UBX domain-containing protein n=3 Tax=Vitis vinifera TaxID=29760 RepID=F6HUF2_VITVI|nr:hypothetical protein VitviT2T_002031 [Vitis vinifera]|eukprot:XP_002276758.1 PREDICTED: plant UBX domain-containing protein 8 [Vitis vinifera]
MATPNQEAIDTFISITGASEAVALRKLEEHGGDLNEAVNAHFSEGDRNIARETSIAAPQSDFMDIDDPIPVESQGPASSLLSAATNLNPLSLLDPLLDPSSNRSLFDSDSDLTRRGPSVSHPREVREIPIEFKDGNETSHQSGSTPTIEDVTDTAPAHEPEIRGAVMTVDEDDDDIPTAPSAQGAGQNAQRDDTLGDSSHDGRSRPIVPGFNNLPDYANDIEEEMVRAAIEASKREVEEGYSNQQFGAHNELSNPGPQQRPSHLEDAALARAVSLSLKTAEQEKALREQGGEVGASELGADSPAEVEELRELPAPNGRQGFGSLDKVTSSRPKLEAGSSSIQDEAEDIDEQPLVRNRTRRMSSGSVESVKETEAIEVSPVSSPRRQNVGADPDPNGTAFHSDEWGGISSEEHDEAVMLEAALFGGIPDHFGFGPHRFMHPGLDRNFPPIARPPSPSLAAQRLIREQQDDAYLASLQADQEKELKAKEEAEARRLQEQMARETALEEERRREEESRRKLEEQQEFERQLAAKEASLPQEPGSDDENAVTLLVRMPDGSRRGRRFLKSDKLQSLFNFIDVGRAVKPGTYRLVRPYPRRAFSDGESTLSLNELGLTSKQEALFLELI